MTKSLFYSSKTNLTASEIKKTNESPLKYTVLTHIRVICGSYCVTNKIVANLVNSLNLCIDNQKKMQIKQHKNVTCFYFEK